ncbi:MAG: hypothetical protein EKK41_02330 [Hyphomicrobiales bacterium]|jgi:hypothetical protein|nr:MAG: hypothetical protein EKK41_02330 [Hyphomicrobiales bacterium]
MPRQTNSPASRERRLRRIASRKGLVLRKVAEGLERGRFYVEPEGAGPWKRGQKAPTFTLDEIAAQIEGDEDDDSEE